VSQSSFEAPFSYKFVLSGRIKTIDKLGQSEELERREEVKARTKEGRHISV